MQRLVSNFFVKAPPQLGFMKKGIPINPDIL